MSIKRQPNGTYHIEFKLLGERVHRSARTKSLREARALEDRLRAEIRAGGLNETHERQPRLTLAEAIERYTSQHLAPQATSTRSLYSTKVLLGRLGDLLGGPTVYLDQIRAGEVNQLKEALLGAQKAPATVNQYLAYLRAILRRAQTEWGVSVDVPPIRLLRLSNARVRSLTDEQEVRLMAALDRREALRGLVRFLLGTGARLREATRLHWTDVDLEADTVTFTQTKNGDRRTIPVSSTVGEMLQRRRDEQPENCPWVNPYFDRSSGPREYRSPHGAFRTACRRAPITDFRIHDLRHTFASRLVSRGVSLYLVSKLLGHRDIRMTQRYAHLSVEGLRLALK